MHRSHINRDNLKSRGQAVSRMIALWLSLGMLVALMATPSIEAKESYAPYIESLQVTQLRAARASAPQGQDEPLSIPVESISLPADPASPVVQESRLEALAEAKSGPLTLAETQQNQVLTSDPCCLAMTSSPGYPALSRL